MSSSRSGRGVKTSSIVQTWAKYIVGDGRKHGAGLNGQSDRRYLGSQTKSIGRAVPQVSKCRRLLKPMSLDGKQQPNNLKLNDCHLRVYTGTQVLRTWYFPASEPSIFLASCLNLPGRISLFMELGRQWKCCTNKSYQECGQGSY